jgi:hypothetical protein
MPRSNTDRIRRGAFPGGCRLVALDWQHPAYWFWPHRQATLDEPWPVPAFPNGDYFILLTDDLSQETFGHPTSS